MTPDELVQRLDTIGWFDGLPAGERERVRAAAADRDLDDPEQVAAAVANLVVALDGVCDPETYRGLVRTIAAAIPWAFRPDQIAVTADEDDDQELRIELTFGDRTYRCVFDQDGDWAEGDVLGFLDGILEDRAGLRLFELPVNAPEAHLVVCRGAAFERAVAEGLVPEVSPPEG